MKRRQILAAAISSVSIAVAGCGGDSDGGSGSDGGSTPEPTPTETPTDEPTPTQTPSPSPTERPEPAAFEIVAFRVPDSVRVGEEHQYEIEVRNTGEQTGMFVASVEASTSETSQWETVGQISISDVGPGESATWTSDTATISQPLTVQYRLEEYDVEVSYDVLQPQPEITLGESAFVESKGEYTTERYAEIEVTNDGDGPAKSVPITVDWYDDGAYLASTQEYLDVLRSGEAWLMRAPISYEVDDESAVNDFEVALGEVDTATTLDPENVSVASSELLASDRQVLVRGQVDNNRDSTLDYVEVVVQVLDGKGNIIGADWTNHTEISPDDGFSFELEPDTEGRNGAVEDHQVLLLT